MRVGPWAVGLARESDSIFDGVVQALEKRLAKGPVEFDTAAFVTKKTTPTHTHTCPDLYVRTF